MKTYREVGESEGLQYNMLERYVCYMEMRWKAEEETQCLSGYSHEWADRFKKGTEYLSSDFSGLRALKEIDALQIAKIDAALKVERDISGEGKIIYLKKINENEVKAVQPEEMFKHMEDVFGEM